MHSGYSPFGMEARKGKTFPAFLLQLDERDHTQEIDDMDTSFI